MNDDSVISHQDFLTALALALHRAGASAPRLEERVAEAAVTLGINATCFATPTSIFVSVGDNVRLLRVEPQGAHLERLVLVDQVAVEVGAGRMTARAGRRELERIEGAPSRYGRVAPVLCTALVSAAATVFFGGIPTEIAAGAVLGLGVGLWGELALRGPGARVKELVAALGVAAGVTLLARITPVSIPILTLSGVIVLLPGLSLTVALSEMASGHLASGTARFAGAMVTFLQLGVGTALGWKLSDLLPRAALAPRVDLPPWVLWAALLAAGVAYVVLLHARPRDSWVVIGMSFLSFEAARLGSDWLGPQLGACAAALLVGLAANLHARVRNLPATVAQLPGLLVLVPGSLGFQGFRAMLLSDRDAGIDAAFTMLLVAGSLVAGLLTAQVILPPRKVL